MIKVYELWWHDLELNKQLKRRLLEEVGAEALFFMSESYLSKYIMKTNDLEKMRESKRHLKTYEAIYDRCREKGIHVVSIGDESYPYYLKEIPDAPLMLFVLGDVEVIKRPMIAMVGSRKCSEYGYDLAGKLSEGLAEEGLCVVSGMARGIDEASHKGALKTGKTIAVLGTGVDLCFPSKNRDIYETIQQSGCVISEFLPGTPGLRHHFPLRNRIISGMSLGTVVVEAAARSGSLITAYQALEQNREVFAIPGNVTSSLSEGTNKLIQDGAKLVMKVDDILEELSSEVRESIIPLKNNCLNNEFITLDKIENMVYDCLSWQPKEIEKLQNELNTKQIVLSGQMIEMVLLKLEMKRLIKRLPARRYSRLS